MVDREHEHQWGNKIVRNLECLVSSVLKYCENKIVWIKHIPNKIGRRQNGKVHCLF